MNNVCEAKEKHLRFIYFSKSILISFIYFNSKMLLVVSDADVLGHAQVRLRRADFYDTVLCIPYQNDQYGSLNFLFAVKPTLVDLTTLLSLSDALIIDCYSRVPD